MSKKNTKKNNDLKISAYRYKRAFDLLFKKQTKELQELIQIAKKDPNFQHIDVNKFIAATIELAESDVEL